MTISCLACRRPIEAEYKACPFCGEPVTDFVRQFSDKPIDGKYEIVSRLGAGGMGDVYKVRHIHLDSIRVVKLMRQNIAGDPSSHERFLREAKLATLIQHPNVSVLHDFATLPDGTAYMVWEYIAGTNLAEVLNERGRLSPRFAAELSIAALHGLEAVHRAGIVHRDISPENLMLTRDESGEEHVKIIDLGIAKGSGALDGATQTGMFVGKWKYASPEHLGALADGERIDGRADLYSFGVVMYEMLSGRPPFIAQTPHQYIVMHTKESPAPNFVSPSEHPGTRKLQDLVLKSLAKKRDDRFPSARAFAIALQEILIELPDATESHDRATDATLVAGGATEVSYKTAAARGLGDSTQVTSTVRSNAPIVTNRPPANNTVVANQVNTTPAAVPPAQEKGGRKLVAVLMISFTTILILAAAVVYMLLKKDDKPPQIADSTQTASTTGSAVSGTGETAATSIDVTSSTLADTSASAATDSQQPTASATENERPVGSITTSSRSNSITRPLRGSQPEAEAEPETSEDEEPESEPQPVGRSADLVAPAKISSRARYFNASPEARGVSQGLIQNYDDMIAGGTVNWFALAPRVRLAEHKIRVNSVRNYTSYQNARIVSMLKSDLQTYLDEATEPAKGTLTADLGIYWAGHGSDKKRGVGVEAVFRDGAGTVVAKTRHLIRENNPEDAMEEMIEAIGDFVEDHDVFQPR